LDWLILKSGHHLRISSKFSYMYIAKVDIKHQSMK